MATLQRSPLLRQLEFHPFGTNNVDEAKKGLRLLTKLKSLEKLTLHYTSFDGERLCFGEKCKDLPSEDADAELSDDESMLIQGEEWEATTVPDDLEDWIRCAHRTKAACIRRWKES